MHLTRRAIADLGLALESCRGRSARDLGHLHEVIRRFLELEGQTLSDQELVSLPTTQARLFQSGDWYGLSWDDENARVTWLLGAVQGRLSGTVEPQQIFVDRGKQYDLFPTPQDYQDLELTTDEQFHYVESLSRLGSELSEAIGAGSDPAGEQQVPYFTALGTLPGLREVAQASPGRTVTRDLDDLLTVSVVAAAITVDGEPWDEVRISIEPTASYPGGLPSSLEWLYPLIMAAILPEWADIAELTIETEYSAVHITWRTRSAW